MAAAITQTAWDNLMDRIQAVEIGQMGVRNEVGGVIQQQNAAHEEFKGNTVKAMITMKNEIEGVINEAKITFAAHREELGQHQNDQRVQREELSQQQTDLK